MIHRYVYHDLGEVFDSIMRRNKEERNLEIMKENLGIINSTEDGFGLEITIARWWKMYLSSQPLDISKYTKEVMLETILNQIQKCEIKIESIYKKLEKLFNRDNVDKMILSKDHLVEGEEREPDRIVLHLYNYDERGEVPFNKYI
jgi:hypothetical protein